jgi:hypothetical protein
VPLDGLRKRVRQSAGSLAPTRPSASPRHSSAADDAPEPDTSTVAVLRRTLRAIERCWMHVTISCSLTIATCIVYGLTAAPHTWRRLQRYGGPFPWVTLLEPIIMTFLNYLLLSVMAYTHRSNMKTVGHSRSRRGPWNPSARSERPETQSTRNKTWSMTDTRLDDGDAAEAGPISLIVARPRPGSALVAPPPRLGNALVVPPPHLSNAIVTPPQRPSNLLVA